MEVETVEEELLRDLDDLENESGSDEELEEAPSESSGGMGGSSGGARSTLTGVMASEVSLVANLKRSSAYQVHVEVFQWFHHFWEQTVKAFRSKSVSSIRRGDEEYKLIVKSNNYISEITNEIGSIHVFVQDHYRERFHGLETVVVNPVIYFHVVSAIQNNLTISPVALEGLLESRQKEHGGVPMSLLAPSELMALTMIAESEKSNNLSEEEIAVILTACDEGISLDNDRQLLIDYVASRMGLLAPNVSALVGPVVAAKVIGKVGGIEELSKMPACNIYLVGQMKQFSGGFSNAIGSKHRGFVFESELVQNAPSDLKQKTAKVLSDKLALAARYDFNGQTNDTYGRELRALIESKIDKWQEPQRTKVAKPMKAPDDQPRKKRGGKRVRKRKETFAVTEIRRKQNRMLFGESNAEYGDASMGVDFGMLGQEGSKQIRIRKQDKKPGKTKYSFATTTAAAGFSSSFGFTPLQAVELVNPDRFREKSKAAADPYFSSSGGFSSVAPK